MNGSSLVGHDFGHALDRNDPDDSPLVAAKQDPVADRWSEAEAIGRHWEGCFDLFVMN
jgi:hypothetical protein